MSDPAKCQRCGHVKKSHERAVKRGPYNVAEVPYCNSCEDYSKPAGQDGAVHAYIAPKSEGGA